MVLVVPRRNVILLWTLSLPSIIVLLIMLERLLTHPAAEHMIMLVLLVNGRRNIGDVKAPLIIIPALRVRVIVDAVVTLATPSSGPDGALI